MTLSREIERAETNSKTRLKPKLKPDISYMVASHLQGISLMTFRWLRTYIRTRTRGLLAGPDGIRCKGPNLITGLKVLEMSQACLCTVQPVVPSLNITAATVKKFNVTANVRVDS